MNDIEPSEIVITHPPEAHKIRNTQAWQTYIWLGAGSGLFLILVLLLTFVAYTVSKLVDIMALRGQDDLAFIFSTIALIDLTLLRLLAILVGAAIAFAGLAVSFFAHEKATGLSGELHQSPSAYAKAALSAYSPGIVGVIIGAVIIVTAVLATIEHSYKPPVKTFSVRPLAETSASDNRATSAVTGNPGFVSKEKMQERLKQENAANGSKAP
ncbi:hypothetical protein [Pseudomonas gozinkensis]|uniref:hypothetical protein n=1 Tax=Pseudomonas gozinkensis TaxID=2774461 RepID=UPI001787FA6B|nr:hypothetical protein [Pseudomonas gozinkensis]